MGSPVAISCRFVAPGEPVTYRGHGAPIKGKVLKINHKGVATVKWTDGTTEKIVVNALEHWDERHYNSDRRIREDMLYRKMWDPDYKPQSGCGSS